MQINSVDRRLFDFPVSLRPVYDEQNRAIPHVKSVTRTDSYRHLAVVSDRYRLIHHQRMVEAFEVFSRQLGNHETSFFQEKDGARVIVRYTFRDINFQMPGHMIEGLGRDVGDVVALQVYGINSYNTTTPLILRVGCLVLRCLNGATALESIFGLNIKHIGREEPEIVLPPAEAVIAAFHRTGAAWQAYADNVVGPRDIDRIVEIAKNNYGIVSSRDVDHESARFAACENLWDIYNAFTYVIGNTRRKIQETSKLSRMDRLNILFAEITASVERNG